MDRRWPLIAAAVVVGLLLIGGAWAAGRATAPEGGSDKTSTANTSPAALQTIDGVAVGVQRSRPGALAAADNYVASVAESVIPRPQDHERILQRVFVPSEREYALAEGRRVRNASPDAVANYAAGGAGVGIIGARRLDTYDGTRAEVTTWLGGIVWGPEQRSTERWSLIETRLRWDGQRWLVERMRPASRPAPTPAVTKAQDTSAYSSSSFERELRGMTAPTYGARE